MAFYLGLFLFSHEFARISRIRKVGIRVISVITHISIIFRGVREGVAVRGFLFDALFEKDISRQFFNLNTQRCLNMSQDAAQNVKMEESWKQVLGSEFSQPYFQQLKQFLVSEKRSGQLIYPAGKLMFHAFDRTPFEAVKVVIIGQDPYHGPGQAHGLSFSVPHGITPPPSLKNIYKELQEDVGITIPTHGNLEKWAAQGVLLLNATLSVRARQAGSHQKKGWEEFTTAAIRELNNRRTGLVFLLWGRYAKQKGSIIDRTKHHVLEAAHPSPLARYGFRGCKHFSKTNELLQAQGKSLIDWQV